MFYNPRHEEDDEITFDDCGLIEDGDHWRCLAAGSEDCLF